MNHKHGKPSRGFAPQVNELDGKKVPPARRPFPGWLRRLCSCQDTQGHRRGVRGERGRGWSPDSSPSRGRFSTAPCYLGP